MGDVRKPPEVVRPHMQVPAQSVLPPNPYLRPGERLENGRIVQTDPEGASGAYSANPPPDAELDRLRAGDYRTTGATGLVTFGPVTTLGTLNVGGRSFPVYFGNHPPQGFVNVKREIGAGVDTYVRRGDVAELVQQNTRNPGTIAYRPPH